VVLGAPDPLALADFYRRLLGWELKKEEADWVMLRAPKGGAGVSVQKETADVRPTSPASPGDQQMMMHLNIAVDDFDTDGARATAAGAVLAEWQPKEDVRVSLDSVRSPFCLFVHSARSGACRSGPAHSQAGLNRRAGVPFGVKRAILDGPDARWPPMISREPDGVRRRDDGTGSAVSGTHRRPGCGRARPAGKQ